MQATETIHDRAPGATMSHSNEPFELERDSGSFSEATDYAHQPFRAVK